MHMVHIDGSYGEDGGFFVQFIDLEEAFTEGETQEQAAFNAQEILTGILAVRLERGEDVPLPSLADRTRHPVVRVIKRIGKLEYWAVFEVRTGRRMLALQSMWIRGRPPALRP
ncbi:MAG TPA: hypothetical protein VNL74_04645 [Methylococcus sp.]|nr:hypothetical protein [Methylococcus sp.]